MPACWGFDQPSASSWAPISARRRRLIALPLGRLGATVQAGAFALLYVFAKSDRVCNIALACMGFALIFYGLNLMTGGLKPLRNMPEAMWR